MKKINHLFLTLAIIFFIMAIAAITIDSHSWKRHGHGVEDLRIFQRAIGGLGMGAIATPIWQFINYDIRVFSIDDSITWPIPGGYSYGPDRTGTVSYFEELPEENIIFLKR